MANQRRYCGCCRREGVKQHYSKPTPPQALAHSEEAVQDLRRVLDRLGNAVGEFRPGASSLRLELLWADSPGDLAPEQGHGWGKGIKPRRQPNREHRPSARRCKLYPVCQF